jgi:stage II sporulation protein GA (sporulation sigma-E factor processing peptidase)
VTYYLDILFLLNGFTDALMLWLTASIRRTQYKAWRLFLAATTGGMFAVWMSLSPLSLWWQAALGKLVCAFLMIALTFGFRPFRAFVRNCAVFLMISFVVAGFIFAAESTLGVDVGTRPLWLVGGLLSGALFSLLVFRSIRARRNIERMTALLTVELGDRHIACRALVDTGHHLFDPITRAPVTIMQFRQWQSILPPNCHDTAMQPCWEQWVTRAEQVSWRHCDRIRMIPFSALGVKQSLLFALRVDVMRVEWNGRSYVHPHAFIAIVPQTLSRTDDFQAIIHPSIVTGAD